MDDFEERVRTIVETVLAEREAAAKEFMGKVDRALWGDIDDAIAAKAAAKDV